jgi:hypothetical protein
LSKIVYTFVISIIYVLGFIVKYIFGLEGRPRAHSDAWELFRSISGITEEIIISIYEKIVLKITNLFLSNAT